MDTKSLRMLDHLNIPDLSRNGFNCIDQQLMVACKYFCDDYWKLFLDIEFKCDSNKATAMEHKFLFNPNNIEAMLKYYGLSYEIEDMERPMEYAPDKLYLALFDVQKYPPSSYVEEEGDHFFLVYGGDEEHYMVNDNFYGKAGYLLRKDIFREGLKDLVILKPDKEYSVKEYDYREVITKLFSNVYYDEFHTFFNYIKETQLYTYRSGELFQELQTLVSYVQKNALVISFYDTGNSYLEICSDVLYDVANQINNIWYGLLKAHLKYEVIPDNIFNIKFADLEKILAIEKKVKEEVINEINNRYCIKDLIHRQLRVYLEDDFLDSRSVYMDHDKFSILYLLDHWETKNNISGLEYHMYENAKTYGEFKEITFRHFLTCSEAAETESVLL